MWRDRCSHSRLPLSAHSTNKRWIIFLHLKHWIMCATFKSGGWLVDVMNYGIIHSVYCFHSKIFRYWLLVVSLRLLLPNNSSIISTRRKQTKRLHLKLPVAWVFVCHIVYYSIYIYVSSFFLFAFVYRFHLKITFWIWKNLNMKNVWRIKQYGKYVSGFRAFWFEVQIFEKASNENHCISNGYYPLIENFNWNEYLWNDLSDASLKGKKRKSTHS